MVIMLSLLAIWLIFVVLVPKWAFNSLTDRLRATAQGHRVYVFAPPVELGRGFVMSGLGEGVRLIQLGLPIYLLCLWAEARGRRRRLAMPSTTTSPLPPAPKAHPPVRQQYVLPPMAWRREWEATLLSRSAEPSRPAAASTSAHAEPPPQQSGPLTIRSLGNLQLLHAGEDLTARLLRAPTLCFIWLFLLTHAAARPHSSVHRQVLAEEAFPGIDPEQQRGRLRGRLSDLQHDLPAILADRVKVDGDLLRLDLETAEFDVARIRHTADDLAAGSGLLTDAGIAAVESGIASHAGEYLPIWDEVERQTTGGRGSAGDLVRAVRRLTEDLHIQLVIRLANHYRARRDTPQAIPLLEEVLRRRPDREDVAQLLMADYQDTGQMIRARQLEMTYRSEFVKTPMRTE